MVLIALKAVDNRAQDLGRHDHLLGITAGPGHRFGNGVGSTSDEIEHMRRHNPSEGRPGWSRSHDADGGHVRLPTNELLRSTDEKRPDD
jgi:hypothetical protein